MAKQTSRPTSSKIDELVNMDPNKIENSVLRAAVEQFKAEEGEKSKKKALEHLRSISRIEDLLVQRLRECRKSERRAKSQLEGFLGAKEQFMKDGNVENYNSNVLMGGIFGAALD